jgi:hypothetical protein
MWPCNILEGILPGIVMWPCTILEGILPGIGSCGGGLAGMSLNGHVLFLFGSGF